MKLNDQQIELIKSQPIAVLSTVNNDGQPRAIFVEINKAEGNEIIITDNEMCITRNNLSGNNKVFVLAYAEDYSKCLKIEGIAAYHTSGKYFDLVKNQEENKDYSPRGAIVIETTNITKN